MSSEAPTSPAPDEPHVWMRALVALLALAFLVKPYLLENELVHDGLKMATRHEVLSQTAEEPGRLTETLTTSWWGELDPGSGLFRPVSSFVLGLAGVVSGEAYESDDPAAAEQKGRLAMPYKLFAIALKVICALLVVELAFLYLGSSRAAFAAGLLFATLPVHGEVLFDVVGIAELLAAAFGLGAWIAWLRGTGPDGNRPAQLALSALLVFLASLSKEGAFALPLVFFLADLGRTDGGGLGAGLSRALRGLPGHAMLGVALAASLALRYAVLGSLVPKYHTNLALVNPLADADFLTRAMNGLRIVACSFPAMLGYQPLSSHGGYSVDYSYAQIEALSAFDAGNLIPVVALGLGVVAALALLSKLPRTGALLLAALGSLLLTSNVPFVSGTVYGDRLVFFASISMTMLLGGLLARVGVLGIAAALALSIGGGYWTWLRSADWATNSDLWRYTAKVSATDSALAHYNLGITQTEDGLDSFARQEFARALEIYPGFVEAHLALAQVDVGDDVRYTDHLRDALEVLLERDDHVWRPESEDELLRPSLLLGELTQRMAIDPGVDPQGHLAWLDDLLARGYESPHVIHRRADTLRGLGRFEEAEAELRRSIEIQPTASAVGGLVRFLRLSDRPAEARAILEEHLSLLESTGAEPDSPEYVEFLLTRGETELASDTAKALATAEEVMALDPEGEQRARALLLRARSTIDEAPSDPVGAAEAERRATDDVIAALQAFPIDSPTSRDAVSMLGPLLPRQNNEQAKSVLEATLADRESTSLRALLGSVYYRLGQHDLAATQFELALAGFVEPDVTRDTQLAWREIRLLQLHNLAELGTPEAQAQVLALLERDRTEAGTRGLHVRRDWFAANGEFTASREAIAGLEATLSPKEFLPMYGLIDLLEELHQAIEADPWDANALGKLASLELGIQARPQALEHARRAVDAAAALSPDVRAELLFLLAQTLKSAEGPSAALEPLRQALQIEDVNPALRARIEQDVRVLEILLGSAS